MVGDTQFMVKFALGITFVIVAFLGGLKIVIVLLTSLYRRVTGAKAGQQSSGEPTASTDAPTIATSVSATVKDKKPPPSDALEGTTVRTAAAPRRPARWRTIVSTAFWGLGIFGILAILVLQASLGSISIGTFQKIEPIIAFYIVLLGILRLVLRFMPAVDAREEESTQKAVESAGRAGGRSIPALFVAFGVISLVGILAAIGVPAYRDYVARGEMASADATIRPLKTRVEDVLARTGDGRMVTAESLDLNINQNPLGHVELGFNFDGSGGLTFVFENASSRMKGGKLYTTRGAEGAWNCNSENIPAKYLPKGCVAGL